MPDTEPATFVFLCPLCHRNFTVDAGELWKARQCPHCNGKVVVLRDNQVRSELSVAAESPSHPNTANEYTDSGGTTVPVTDSGSSLVIVPVALYIVAALFFAKGLFTLLSTIAEAVDTRVVEINGLLAAAILTAIGWGLAHCGERSRRAATFILACGIVFRLLFVMMLAFFLREYLAGRVSYQSRSALVGKSGAHLSVTFGSMKIYSVSASPKTGWYLVQSGKERRLKPVDVLGLGAFWWLGIALNLWQRRVLRRQDTLRVFGTVNRANLSGQMSLVRFLLLTTVFLSIHLAIWKAGWGLI